MKKTKLSSLGKIALAVFAFSGCHQVIGLGEAVDLEPPEVYVTSVKDNDYVPTIFTLAGTASDNEKVTRLSIDFDEADIHFVFENEIWKRKAHNDADWQEIEAEKSSFSRRALQLNWSVEVDLSKGKDIQNSSYNFTVIAADEMGNAGKKSKIESTVTVDANIPDVSINRPELFANSNEVKEASDSLKLQDANSLSKLFNGELNFAGRQDFAISFKELRIEFDDGTEDSLSVNSGNFSKPIGEITTENISNAYDFGRTKLYYSKTFKSGENAENLRTWQLTLPQSDWINSAQNQELQTGKHIIRVVTTTITNSGTWQRKILGYFVWWQEADKPWITFYSGSDSLENIKNDTSFPSQKIFGNVCDDDGIKSLKYTFEKQNADKIWEKITSGDIPVNANSQNIQWNVTTPAEAAVYKLTVEATDLYGNKDTITKYLNVLDIQPPKIELNSPSEEKSVLESGDGKNIIFNGTISDDGTISSLKIAYLNPNVKDLNNNIKFVNSAEKDWRLSNESDKEGNFIFDIPVSSLPHKFNNSQNRHEYALNKTFNIFDDLNIGENKELSAQNFVVRAEDSEGGTTILPLSIKGDEESPEITLENLTTYKDGNQISIKKFADGNVTLPARKDYDFIEINGRWSDNSTTKWRDISKIGKINLEWTNEPKTFAPGENGEWKIKIEQKDIPAANKTIKVSIKDYANNEAQNSSYISVDSTEARIDKIGSENENGSYKAGSQIIFTVNFTKSVKFEGGTPSLEVKIGNKTGTADYKNDDKNDDKNDGGNGTHQLKFTYNIPSDAPTGEKILITKLNKNGCKFTDISTNTEVIIDDKTVSDLPESKKLESRNLTVDTQPPFINSITSTTDAGFYNAGKQIRFEIKFNEPVNIDDLNNINFTFNAPMTKENVQKNNEKVSLTYKVEVGNSDFEGNLQITGFASPITITDNAENSSTIRLPDNAQNYDVSKIHIDTKSPAPPTVNFSKNVNNDDVITDGDGIKFTIDGEEDAKIEYSLNDGESYTAYKTEVSLSNNGNYRVKSRQTDKAGNFAESSVTSFTIDKGALLKKISATTYNGTYKTDDTIKGYLEFRKAVTLSSEAEVVLNVKNKDGGPISVLINNPTSTAEKFYFDYKISDGDFIDERNLNVTDIQLGSVTLNESKVDVKLPESNLAQNREIKIVTGNPTVQTCTIEKEEENSVCLITFDREITKGSGNITFTLPKDYFKIPVVLTETEYYELSENENFKDIFKDIIEFYKPGMNGATLNSDETLTPDTSKKYILDFEKNDDINDVIKKAFIDAKKNIIEVDVISSKVTAEKNVLKINLKGEFKLPVKGAEYEVTIPEGVVKDMVGNENKKYLENNLVAPGVEKPVIRIKKDGYTITNAGNTLTANVTMPATASMKLSCRTPGATINYTINSTESREIKIIDRKGDKQTQNYKSKETDEPKIDKDISTYKQGTTDSLGEEINDTNFENIKGMKFAITAVAKANGTTETEIAYEYAARTVLKFQITDGGYDDGKDNNGKTDITENGTLLYTKDLQIWVIGGDSPAGGNTLNPFPLSWNDSSNFKLMKCAGNRDQNLVSGDWYWITWDLSAPAYHGFAAGTVPIDAKDKGPGTWFVGECHWAPNKTDYPLYPGETLNMVIQYDSNSGYSKYYFRIKNKGTRE